jgi:O-antigen ligase
MSDYLEAGRRDFGGGTRVERADAVTEAAGPDTRPALERAAWLALLAFAAALQLSIFAAQILLTVTAGLWIALVIRNHERIEFPRMFWPLAAYAGVTLVSAVFSIDPDTSLVDCKQLLLFAIVPIVYRLLPGRRTMQLVDVIITVGAIEATYGIVQYGILDFDHLGRRVQGAMGHYMTYSGLVMLVACTAMARIMFRSRDRMWASLVMPALLVALALTMSRNAWVGACVGIGLLFLLRDFRLIGLLPVVAAVFIAFAPAQITARLYSTFSLSDPSNRDRLAMVRSGLRIIQDDPLTGVGPNMVIQVYPHYRDPDAENQPNPHLHNVPLQIAAERGIPALIVWLWFIVSLTRDVIRKRRTTAFQSIPTAALACIAAMLAAGMFEYNFGDSEFLMLFLVLVTLPYAAERVRTSHAPSLTRQQPAA